MFNGVLDCIGLVLRSPCVISLASPQQQRIDSGLSTESDKRLTNVEPWRNEGLNFNLIIPTIQLRLRQFRHKCRTPKLKNIQHHEAALATGAYGHTTSERGLHNSETYAWARRQRKCFWSWTRETLSLPMTCPCHWYVLNYILIPASP
jgi:hypothetical protein